ncbi:MAG: sensor histidine kinase [Candidatus Pristimantibacillus sp.]|uniref:sensor histidine kinase n=1 Tax=Paenibacillus sp. FSL H7-0331 TaxID=1920421 RepID=UPI0021161578|nr:HAMP domain-containing sensor histidine kinase [Paenibacillus sp. FSL H7-0331]
MGNPLKRDKLIYRLIKSYTFFAITLGVVNLAFLFLVLDTDSQTIEISLPGLVLLLLFFGLNVYVYSLWTAKRITRPLEHIAGAIQRMERGQYAERLHIKAGYEFTVIQQHFNDMAETLERIELENRRLQDSKQQMLADLSHDLMTPITTIKGYANALQLGMVDSEEKKERYLQLIGNKATLVAALIDDIFNLSKLERTDYPLSAESGDLAELLREIAADYYDQFEDKRFVLELSIPSEEVIVDYDCNLMRRAISNLLANALMHNPSGTDVVIQLVDEKAVVRLSVIDNGIGISDRLKEVIFDPFVRGDYARPGDGGTGLGLAIAKQTLELHGGELNLDTSHGRTAFELVLYRKI